MALNLIRYQLANGPPKLSFKGALENVKRRTLNFLRILSRKKDDGDFVERVEIFRSLREPRCSKLGRRQFFRFFESGIFRRAAEWSRDSLASVFTKKSGHRVFQGTGGVTISFVGFVLSSKPSLLTEEEEVEGLSYEIRETFAKNSPKHLSRSISCPSLSSFSNLEIGNLLAQGCNAAVYCARWKNQSVVEGDKKVQKVVMEKITGSETSEQPFDLAVKVMFNYSAHSDAAVILKAMFKEALPALMLPFEPVGIKQHKRIFPHPNIVEMYCAFADNMPLLEDALTHYPQALPFRLTKQGFGRNMTLFLVMKRYDCCLKDYLNEHNISPHTSLLLFCQLLEGIVHLLQHGFVHRDLKTDNILLDMKYGDDNPLAAITDFGCCLDDWKLPYVTEEIDRGGNLALMAPEVATATPGPFSTIDYSRSDLWTLGTIAYEIFGAKNPFYLSEDGFLESSTYSEHELPPLPSTTPKVIQKLIKDMLHRDPKLRPTPSLAATVCQLLLHAPPDLLSAEPSKENSKKLAHWMFLMSSETFLQSVIQQNSCSSLEHELRYTFCCRIQFSELIEAIRYISTV